MWSYEGSRLMHRYHTIRLLSDLQKYWGITSFYRSPTYYYLRLGMDLSVTPAIRKQVIDKVFKNTPNRDRYKIIMDNARTISTQNIDKSEINSITSHMSIFDDYAIHISLIFLLKERKTFYTTMREMFDALIKWNFLSLGKNLGNFREWSFFCPHFSSPSKTWEKHLIAFIKYKKREISLNGHKDDKKLVIISNSSFYITCIMNASSKWKFKLESDTSKTAAGVPLFSPNMVNG